MSDNPFDDEVQDIEMPMLTNNKEKKNEEKNKEKPLNSNVEDKLSQLKARESELLKRQQRINQTKSDLVPSENWPLFFPLVRYNLISDIPPNAHSAVNMSLYGLITFLIHSIFNVISVIFVIGLPRYPTSKCLIFSIIQGFAASYFILNFGYRKLYVSCANHDIPFQFTLFQFLIVGWIIYLVIGFPDSGSVGFAVFLDLLSISKSTFSKIISFINLVILIICLYFEFRCLIESQKYQKISGNDQNLINNNNTQKIDN